jgi:uncharacterized membrane protein
MALSARIRVIAAFGGLSVLALCLLALRWAATGSHEHLWLAWNLLLAWVPFALALAIHDGHRQGSRPAALLVLGALWLLFFPNAPYILTDYIHLEPHAAAPLWYDALLISSFALAGLLLGFASLYLVQAVVRARLGELVGWGTALAAIALSSVGIYLGRFVRVNSWDVFTNPDFLIGIVRLRLADPLGNPKLIAVSVLFTAFLSVTYLAVYSLASLEAEMQGRRG